MKRKFLALAAIPAAIAAFSIGSGGVEAHNADAGCIGSSAFFSVDSYPSGSTYSLDGGAVTPFSGGFSKSGLSGTAIHTLTLVTGDGLTQFNRTLQTTLCTQETTTSPAPTTSTTQPGSSSTSSTTSTAVTTTSPTTTVEDSTTVPGSTAPSTTATPTTELPREPVLTGFCGSTRGSTDPATAYFQGIFYPADSQYSVNGGSPVPFDHEFNLALPGVTPNTVTVTSPDARGNKTVTTPACPQPEIVPTTTIPVASVPQDVCMDINPATGIGVTNIHFLPCGPGLPACSDAGQQIVPPTDGSCDTTTVAAPTAAGPAAPVDTHLPVTGAYTVPTLALAAILVGLGTLVLIARRRRHA